MEESLGALLSAGHDLDHLLNTYSFAQLSVMTVCVQRARFGFVNALLAPMVGAIGGKDAKYKPGAPRAAKERSRRAPTKPTSEMNDAELTAKENAFLGKLGRFQHTVAATTPGKKGPPR